jgi:hypothetical protein
MKAERILIAVLMLALAFTLGIEFSQAQVRTPDRSDSLAPDRPEGVSPYISIQGRLTDASGSALNGSYNMIVRVYDASSGGTILCSDPMTNVPVNNGLFEVSIYCAAADGRELWLGITVGSDPEMTPRRRFGTVPYAQSLRPGAIISDTLNNAIVHIENWSETGRGLRTYAMATTGVNYGLVAASRSAQGYAGYIYNDGGGTGLYVRSIDDGNDLILAGNDNTTVGDDGILSSDPTRPSSDLILRTNDGIRIELDHDGSGESADLEVRDMDNHIIFNVNNSGNVSYSGALVGAFPRPAYDSGWTGITQGHSDPFTHSLGGSIDNYIVDLTCKSGAPYNVNGYGVGGDMWYEPIGNYYYYGAYWYNLTTSTITVTRGDNDDSCGWVRVRIWVSQ